jgi:hypothetical protein
VKYQCILESFTGLVMNLHNLQNIGRCIRRVNDKAYSSTEMTRFIRAVTGEADHSTAKQNYMYICPYHCKIRNRKKRNLRIWKGYVCHFCVIRCDISLSHAVPRLLAMEGDLADFRLDNTRYSLQPAGVCRIFHLIWKCEQWRILYTVMVSE